MRYRMRPVSLYGFLMPPNRHGVPPAPFYDIKSFLGIAHLWGSTDIAIFYATRHRVGRQEFISLNLSTIDPTSSASMLKAYIVDTRLCAASSIFVYSETLRYFTAASPSVELSSRLYPKRENSLVAPITSVIVAPSDFARLSAPSRKLSYSAAVAFDTFCRSVIAVSTSITLATISYSEFCNK